MLNRNREWCNKIIYNVTIYKTLKWTELTTLKLPLSTETLIWINIVGSVGGSLLRCNYYHEYLACEEEDLWTIHITWRGLRINVWRALSDFAENCSTRTLHYPFNWIRFVEINKLCNVKAENLTFSTNRKLISISWKCSNFSTNWKWKWMNRIRHVRKIVIGKQKFELIWKIIYLHKSSQFACY